MTKNVLILTLAGGGGHLQAAKAKRQEVLAADPETTIYEQDVFIQWVNKKLGIHFLGKWNEWQRTGEVSKQARLIKYQPLADKFFWPFIFVNALYMLLSKDIDQIIDTQNLGTSAILLAIRIVRKLTKKNLILEKVITELPTDQVTHFFKPIKGLSKKSKAILRIMSTAPLLKENQTAEHFWQEQCGMPESSVVYGELPLRPSFIRVKQQPRKLKAMEMTIKTQTSYEKELIESVVAKGSAPYTITDESIKVSISPEDRVSIVMLGSRPNEHATMEYVNNFINILSTYKQPKKRDLLFVFCNNQKTARGYLLDKVSQLVLNSSSYPNSLTVVPLPFQEDEVIAPLFFRSDATFTRSGGLTAMELLSVCGGQIWIHSEEDKSGKTAVKMPHWEEGNAYYLKAKKGAQFITPDNFKVVCSQFFS